MAYGRMTSKVSKVLMSFPNLRDRSFGPLGLWAGLFGKLQTTDPPLASGMVSIVLTQQDLLNSAEDMSRRAEMHFGSI